MEDNKVKVRIYGQDYIISGERDEETIKSIAQYVDEKIHEIARVFSSCGQNSLAVLAAVNIADELFDMKEKLDTALEGKVRAEKDVQHYLCAWEETKKNFVQHKEDGAKLAQERQAMENKLRQLEENCREQESSYFELQMENIQLKSQLEKLKRQE